MEEPTAHSAGRTATKRLEQMLEQIGHEFNAFPLSFAQQRLWFFEQLQPHTGLYTMPVAVHLSGTLDIPALQQSLNAIVARHEALRTTFMALAGQPFQVVAPRLWVRMPVRSLVALPVVVRQKTALRLARAEAQRPFDLVHGPLLRTVLLCLDADEYLLLLTLHHIVADGWSLGVLVHELIAHYDARVAGVAAPLPELPIQYADYAIWQRETLHREALLSELAYWRDQLAGAPPFLELPSDQPRSSMQTFQGARRAFAFPKRLGQALNALSQREGVSLFMTLLAAFQTLLYRYTGQADLVLGTPIAQRTHPDTAQMIGCFVNMVVLRTDLSGNPRFRELLGRVRAVCLSAYAHQDLPFEQLVEAVLPTRDPSHTPLVQVVIVLQNAPLPALELPGLAITTLELDPGTAKFDLTLDLTERPEGLGGACEYRTELFGETMIARLLKHLQTALEDIAAHPGQRLADVALLTAAERQQLLVEWSATAAGVRGQGSGVRSTVADSACLHDLVAAQAARAPDAIALVYETKDERRRRKDESAPFLLRPWSFVVQLTYAELNARANQLAHYLRALGVGPEVLVGICLERSLELVIGLLGILKAGAAYLPLDPAYPPERLAFMLDDAQVQVLITQQPMDDGRWTMDDLDVSQLPIVNRKSKIVNLDADWPTIAQQPATILDSGVTPANLAYSIYTSGSTGSPKAVLVRHASVVHLFAATHDWFEFGAHDVWTLFHAATFDFSVWELWGALCYGGRLIVVPYLLSRAPESFYRLLARERVSVLNQTPSAFEQLLWAEQAAATRAALALRLVIFGGEALDHARLAAWFERHGDQQPQLVNMYGITETTVHVTYRRLRQAERDVGPASVIGSTIPGLCCSILDVRMQPVPIGVPGELYIGGAGLARGYLGRPDLTAERFVPNPFAKVSGIGSQVSEEAAPNTRHPQPATRLYKTGDLARYQPSGEIEYLGRVDQQVKLRGFRIEPGEIEAALLQHEAVRTAVVVLREDGQGAKRLVAYVVPSETLNDERRTINGPEWSSSAFSVQRSALAGELRAFLAARLPDYMIPAAFVLLQSLPLTPNGKVDRQALPAPDRTHHIAAQDDGALRTPVEALLAAIWAEVIGLEPIAAHDNFFEIGGHSLLATQVISRVRETFGVELPLRNLFETPTIAGLAEQITAHRRGGQDISAPPLVPVARSTPSELSFAQQRLWFLDQLEQDSPTYIIPMALQLAGPLDLAVLRRSLSAIIMRQESLRTTFALVNDRPVQVIAPPQPLQLPLLDLQMLLEDQRSAAALRLARAEARCPFDLARGPLLRATLLRVAAAEHILLLTMHHIVSDGWSMGVFVDDLAAFYGAGIAGRLAALPDLPIQYADYAIWQRAWLQGDVIERQLDYWRRQLAGLAPLDLPTDHPRPPVASFRGTRQAYRLPDALGTGLLALSRRAGVTLFMTMLAAFQTVLARYSGQDDIVVGTPIAGRNHKEIEGAIGCFINTLALRTDLSGNPRFQQVLWRVREVTLDAYAHQDLPFEMLVEALQPARDLSRQPLFQVMLVMQNAPLTELELPGLAVRLLEVEHRTAKFDINLSVQEVGAALEGWLEYSTDLFEATTINRMLRHFRTLLEGIVAQPEQAIAGLPLLSLAERAQLLIEWNDTAAGVRGQGSGVGSQGSGVGSTVADSACLHDLVAAQAARTPDAIALAFDFRDKETRRQGDKEIPGRTTNDDSVFSLQLTYHELNERANQLAQYLRRMGVAAEVRVGLSLERSLELVLGLLGVLKAGGVYVPLDPSYPHERLAFMLDDAQVAVLLTATTDDGRWTMDEETQPESLHDLGLTIRDLRASPAPIQNRVPPRGESKIQNPEAGNLAYVIYTSGSTGRPKGAMNTHHAVVNRLRWMQSAYQLTPADAVLQKTPISFDVSIWEFFWPLISGARLVLARPQGHQDSAYLAALIAAQRITTLHFVPAMLQVFLEEPQLDRCRTLRHVICSGEELPAELAERARARLGSVPHNLYGPTEAAVDVTAWLCRPERRQRVPIGRPIANTQIYLLDRYLQPVPIGTPGELYIGGVQLARGYLSRPDMTAERFVPNPWGSGFRVQGSGVTDLAPDPSTRRQGDKETEQSPIQNRVPRRGESKIQNGTRLYKTGDLARYRSDGAIEFLGRQDQQIKLRGFRIELGEIAAVLTQHPAVRESVVLAREDGFGDKRLVAYVVQGSAVRDQGAGSEDKETRRQGDKEETANSSFVLRPSSFVQELRGFLQQRLPDYMLPAVYVFLDALPLTANGKVDRRALPEPSRERSVAEERYVAPRTPIEETLAQIWANVLQVEQVGIYDHFFEAGGHSLLATRLIARVRDTFQVELPLRSLFEAPTIAGLADRIASARQGATQLLPPPLRPAPRDGPLPLSFAQQRLWFINQMDPESPAYNMPTALRLSGSLDLMALDRSLSAIMQRHETLRTTFVLVAGQPAQLIAPLNTRMAHGLLRLPLLDLHALPEQEREALAVRLASAEAQRPFDLGRGPLVRATLLRLDAHEHIVLLTMHHIVSDGWSIGLFIREITTLYVANATGTAVRLSELPIQYADYAVWQREWLQGAVLADQLGYWKAQMADLPTLQLPTDHPRPAVATFQGASYDFLLPQGLSEALAALSRHHEVTLFMTLLAAFQVLLARYSGQNDIVVGAPIANRTQAAIENLIGFFVNTLALRSDLSGNPTFGELLARVREVCLSAYAHQELPFERLVEELQPARDLSYAPLVQVMFALQNMSLASFAFAGLTLTPTHLPHETAKFDLGCDLWESPHGLMGRVEYATDLFEAATIARFVGHLRTLLAGIAANQAQHLADLPLLTDVEQQQILVSWNATHADYPLDQGIHTFFEGQAQRAPDAVALVFDCRDKETRRQGDKETTGRTTNDGSAFSLQLTYQALNERANQLAWHLRRHGVGPDVCVGLFVERSLELVIGLLGILKAGGAFLPLDPAYPPDRLAFMIEDANVAIVLTTDGESKTKRQADKETTNLPVSLSPHLRVSGRVVDLRADWPIIAGMSAENPTNRTSTEQLAYVIYTSGSTGWPKGIPVAHRAIGNRLCWSQATYPLGDVDRVIQVASLSFDIAVWELLGPLLAGACVVLAPAGAQPDAALLIQMLAAQRVTVAHVVPSLLQALVADPGFAALRQLRGVLCGGEELTAKLQAQLFARLDADLLHFYGPTEASINATWWRCRPEQRGQRIPIGHPIANMQVYLLDQQLQPVPVGVPGEVYLGGVGLARGYLGRPDLTADRFVPNPFANFGFWILDFGLDPIQNPKSKIQNGTRLYKTGDLARFCPDGALVFLGRIDQQVKLRGVRIELGEVAAVLRSHPAVDEALAVVREDVIGDRRLVAYVVPNLQEPDLAAQLAAAQAEHVAHWQMLYDETYRQPAAQADPTFNLTGWNSSYTGQPIPEPEMREWLDWTVAQVRRLEPRRVLEIGCGMGLLLLRIAPHCTQYWGTDFAPESLRAVQQQVTRLGLAQVRLLQRYADDFTDLEPGGFDLVILNSVVQYFPSIDYLLQVLTQALPLLRPGGYIFVGDVRSLPLLDTLHADVQLHHAPATLPTLQLRQRVHHHVHSEEELLLDPAFFSALQERLPQIGRVDLQLKRGHVLNELTKFRYDVVLQVSGASAPAAEHDWLDWQEQHLTVATLRQMLATALPQQLGLRRVPNARLYAAVKAYQLLMHPAGPASVDALDEALRAALEQGPAAVDPAELWELERELPYRIAITWAGPGEEDCYDVLLTHCEQGELALCGSLVPRGAQKIEGQRPWSAYANAPLWGKLDRRLVPQLRSSMQKKLPAYMMPSMFRLLEALPLTPNGKVDHSRLPAPDTVRPAVNEAFVAPRTPIEQALASIWADVLHIEQVGIHDNFFALGGHSLLATQVVARVRESLALELPLRSLFEAPTVAGLAERVAVASSVAPHPLALSPRSISRTGALPLSFAQQRLWFLDQLEPDNTAYTIPIALRLAGPLSTTALAWSLTTVARRHEILRTTFATLAGQPMQLISAIPAVPLALIDLQTVAPVQREALALQLVDQATRRPFDLARGPLLRILLLRLAQHEHILLLNLHHIISDGWSVGVLIDEFATLYADHMAARSASLPALPIQYADFAVWQREYLQGDVRETQLAYWRDHLAGLPTLDLPTDHPRPLVQTFQGASRRFVLPATISADLAALSQREGVTRFMLLLAAWQVVLARYSGQDDIVVGTPIAGRIRAETERLIGFFVNTLVLRSDLRGSPSFREVLQRVRDVCLGAYAHQDLPFEQVVDALQPARDLGRHPLFQVLFALQNAPMDLRSLPGLTLRPLDIEIPSIKFDLTLSLVEEVYGLAGTLEYCTDLFDAPTIARIWGHFGVLLAGIVAEPTQRFADLPLLTDGERQQLLVAWNDTSSGVRGQGSGVGGATADASCVHQLFEAQAERTPDAVALVFDFRDKETGRQGDKETTGRTTNDGSAFSLQPSAFSLQLTYQALNERANQLAWHLRRHGVGVDVCVGLCMERSLELVVGILGILKAGGAFVPLDPSYPAARLAFMLDDAQAKVLITDAIYDFGLTIDDLEGSQTSIVNRQSKIVNVVADWPLIAGMSAENPTNRTSADQLAYVIYTSGSTGQPKGAMNVQRGICNRLLWMQQTYRLLADDRMLQKTPVSFDVSVWEIFWPLLVGAPLVLARPEGHKDSAYLARLVARSRITTLHFVPSMLQAFLDEPGLAGCRDLRQVFCSGEALPLDLQERCFARLEAELHNLYGPTEASIEVTFWDCERTQTRQAVPIGRPIANTQIYLLDARMQPVPVGVPGELYIGGIGVARGYLRRPDLTAERFVPNPFSDFGFWILDFGLGLIQNPKSKIQNGMRLYKTGDLARYRPDGAIEFLGRIDHQVKLRGFRIELGEIEALLAQHPSVRESVVLACEDVPGHKRLVAYVVQGSEVRDQGSGAEDKQTGRQGDKENSTQASSFVTELHAFLRSQLPDYMLPAAFIMLERLPLLPNGKVDRRALPAPDRAGVAPEQTFVAARGPVEQRLAQIWAEVLQRDSIGIHDNFFALGGDSILSIRVIARANQAGLRLTPKQLFQHQTIADLAMIAGAESTALAEPELALGSVPLTPIQHWFFEQQLADPDHWNQAVLLKVRLDPSVVARVVRQLLAHHDALRLRFVERAHGWQQINGTLAGPLPFGRADLRAVPELRQSAVVEAIAATLQASLNLAAGPLLRAAYIDLGLQRPGRLLIVAHHLVIDAVSWQVLLEDFELAYQQLHQNRALALAPKPASFQRWAVRLAEYARSPTLQHELAYWRDQPYARIARLPIDYPAGVDHNTRASVRSVSQQFSFAETQALVQDVHAAYHTQIGDLLLTALVLAFSHWTAANALLIDLEGHGREPLFDDIDLSRSVGWFTTIFPLILEAARTGPGDALKRVKEQRNAIPNRGIGYGLLRYLGGDQRASIELRALPQAEVLFNYLGQVDHLFSGSALFRPAEESPGPNQSERGRRLYLLEISGIIAGGRLQLDWLYSEQLHHRTTIERLADAFGAALRSLIDHCLAPETGGYTPSDFPKMQLDQADLDDLIAKLTQEHQG